MLDQYYDRTKYGDDPKEIFEEYNSSNIDNPRKTVIASHNSISYQVDGMTNSHSIHTHVFEMKDGT